MTITDFTKDLTTRLPAPAETRETLDKYLGGLRDRCQSALQDLDVQKAVFASFDYTTLNTTDSEASVRAFARKVNRFAKEYPYYPNVAGVCVYPNRVAALTHELGDAPVLPVAVAGGFPTGQANTNIKAAEARQAVTDGAKEVDMVLSVGDFLSGEWDYCAREVAEVKNACTNDGKSARLKVILETAALEVPNDFKKTVANIWNASLVAIAGGADLIKTSTGKIQKADLATAVHYMCRAVSASAPFTDRQVGVKVAGGVNTPEEATLFFVMASEFLGRSQMTENKLFRIGTSRLANKQLALMEKLRTGEEKEIAFF